MKNFEKYEYQISKLVNEDNALTCSIAIVSGMKKQNMCSSDDDCNECSKECLKWMHSEYKEQILTDDEKEIVKAMCDFAHKCGRYVIYVSKFIDELNGVYIYCKFDNADFIESPWLEKNMFKGMDNSRKYKLEELWITCQTQKDS